MAIPSKPAAPVSPRELVAYVDGGSRGNPGPSGLGVVIQDTRGRTLKTFSEYLGETTNNVAEYRALVAALEYAVSERAERLKVYCDSELVALQMRGRYRVQSAHLRPLYLRARELADRLPQFSIVTLPREQNRQADRLANEAMDRGGASPSPVAHSFTAVVEDGKLRPLQAVPELEEGAEYEVRARKRTAAGSPQERA